MAVPSGAGQKGRRDLWTVIQGGAAVLSSLVAVLAFLLDRPLFVWIGLVALLLVGYFWGFTLVMRRNAWFAAGVSIVLAVVTFGAGMLVPPALRPIVLEHTAVLPIEAMDLQATTYEGARMGTQGTGQLVVRFRLPDGNGETSYQLNHDLPDTGDGKAGLVLKFSEPLDITPYRTLTFDISFSDEQSRCNLYFKDMAGESDAVMLGDGKLVQARESLQAVEIVLGEHFKNIARSQLREIGCGVDTSFVRGNHFFQISRVRFER